MPPAINLRQGQNRVNLDNSGYDAARDYEIANTSQFGKGWTSAAMTEDANRLMSQALSARLSGDNQLGDALELQGRDTMARAAQWAPRVAQATDIGGVGDAVDWAASSLGNVRSSIKPALGGLAGAAVGGVGGLLVGGPGGAAAGARWGGRIGAGLGGGQSEYDEAAANAMLDDKVRSTRSYEDIRNAALGKGAVNMVLEGAVPAVAVEGLLGTSAAKQVGKKAALQHFGKEYAGEAATEGAQNLVGQGAQNWLKKEDLGNLDYQSAFNDAMAGGVAGGGMALPGSARMIAQDQLGKAVGKVTDTAKDFASNPMGKVGDALADIGGKVGSMMGDKEFATSPEQEQALADDLLHRMNTAGLSKEDQLKVVQDIQAGNYGSHGIDLSQADHANLPDDMAKDAELQSRAQSHAAKIMRSPREYSSEELAAAAKFSAGQSDYVQFRSELERAKENKKARAISRSIDEGMGKASKMGATSELYEIVRSFSPQKRKEWGKELQRKVSEYLGPKPSEAMLDEVKRLKALVAEGRQISPSNSSASMTAHGETVAALADLWLQEDGAKFKLFKNPSQDTKTMVTKLMEWVRSGYGKEHGETFVPAGFVDEYGDKAADIMLSMSKLVEKQGLMRDDKATDDMRKILVEEAMNKTGDNNFIDGTLLPLAHNQMTPQATRAMVAALRSSKGKPSKEMRNVLKVFFGHNLPEVLKHFTDKASRGRHNPLKNTGSKTDFDVEKAAESITNGATGEDGERVLESDALEMGESTDDEFSQHNKDDRKPTEMRGYQGTVHPFDLADSAQSEAHTKEMAALGDDGSVRAKSVGVWKQLKDAFRGEQDAEAEIRDNEDFLIQHYAPKLSEAEGAQVRYDPNDVLTEAERRKLLGMINKQFQHIQVEHVGEMADPGKLDKDASSNNSIASYKYVIPKKLKEQGVTEADLTANKGFLFIERVTSTGRASHFPINTQQLLSTKAFGATKDNPDAGYGALGLKRQVLSMLTNLMYSEKQFKRIGFRVEKGGPILWLEGSGSKFATDDFGNRYRVSARNDGTGPQVKLVGQPTDLPGETKLGKEGHTVADANKQAAQDRRAGDNNEGEVEEGFEYKNLRVAYAETLAEKQAQIEKVLTEVRRQLDEVETEFRKKWAGWFSSSQEKAEEALQTKLAFKSAQLSETLGFRSKEGGMLDPVAVLEAGLRSERNSNKVYTKLRNQWQGSNEIDSSVSRGHERTDHTLAEKGLRLAPKTVARMRAVVQSFLESVKDTPLRDSVSELFDKAEAVRGTKGYNGALAAAYNKMLGERVRRDGNYTGFDPERAHLYKQHESDNTFGKGFGTKAMSEAKARRRFDKVNDDQLVDRATDDNIVPSEAHDSLQTGIRREDPAGGQGDGRAYTGKLTKPFPQQAKLDRYEALKELGNKRSPKLEAEFRAMEQEQELAEYEALKKLAHPTKAQKERLSELKKINLAEMRDAWALQHTSYAADVEGSIKRDTDGNAVGLGQDALGAGYGGHQVVDKRFDAGGVATKAHPNPSTTKGQKQSAAELQQAQEGLMKQLTKGVPAMVAWYKALPESLQDVVDVALLGVDTKNKVTHYTTKSRLNERGEHIRVFGDMNNVGEEVAEDKTRSLVDMSAAELKNLFGKVSGIDIASAQTRLQRAKDEIAKLRNKRRLEKKDASSKQPDNDRGALAGKLAGTPMGEDERSAAAHADSGAKRGANPGRPEAGVAERSGSAVDSRGLGAVTLPKTSPYTAKDQAKSDKANKFIGRGSANSSTAKYAGAWGDRANSGIYTSEDRVFISAEGSRSGRVDPDFSEIKRAVDAGATIITDAKADRERAFNVGERQVAEFLEKSGYREVTPGEWSPAKADPVAALEAVPANLRRALEKEEYAKLGWETKDDVLAFAREVRKIADAWDEVNNPAEGEDFGPSWDKHYDLGQAASQLVYDAEQVLKNADVQVDFASFFDGIEHTDADVREMVDILAGDGDVKYSRMSTDIHQTLGKEGFGATHDSPIRHEGKFNWRDHIGKGEGNAAFGAGTYLSTANGVHKMYKKQFTADLPGTRYFTWGSDVFEYDPDTGDIFKNGDLAKAGTGHYEIAHAMLAYGLHPKEALEQAKDQIYSIVDRSGSDIADLISVSEFDVPNSALHYLLNALRERKHIDEDKVHTALKSFLSVARWNKALDRANRLAVAIENIDVSELKRPLSAISPTYHVTVNAKPEELLDWDAPLSEQAAVLGKIENAVLTDSHQIDFEAPMRGADTGFGAFGEPEYSTVRAGDVLEDVVNAPSGVTGAEVYRALSAALGSQAKASDYLQSLGIVGHKYNSEGGRNSKFPNYVIYDDSRIETNYVSFSKQKGSTKATPEQQQAAYDFLTKALGDSVDLSKLFKKLSGVSGVWKRGKSGGKNIIHLGINGDVLGAAYHESMHELFDILTKHGNEETKAALLRVATNPIMLRKLENLLNDHPDAVAQLKQPEEALAFMFQFHQMGLLKIGEQTKGVFDAIKKILRKIAGIISETVRAENKRLAQEGLDADFARNLLGAFASGAYANSEHRQVMMDALKKDTEAHNQAVEAVGKSFVDFGNKAGKLFFSAEAMMDLTGNKHMVELARLFNHKVGTEMISKAAEGDRPGYTGSYLDAVRGNTNIWMNRLESMFTRFDKDTLELARQALSMGKVPGAPKVAEAVKAIREFYEAMYDYADKSDVRRLSPDRTDGHGGEVWEKLPRRKDYGITQVWDTDTLIKQGAQFKADLLKHHAKKLAEIADEANRVVADPNIEVGVNTAAYLERERALAEFEKSGKVMAQATYNTITPEQVADALLLRLLNSQGKQDITESESDMGITPMASAINRRTLDWLDGEVFDKYKSKDLANIMSTYVRSMVKRAESQKRFGYGGEVIRDTLGKAVLQELGGDKLVKDAVDLLPLKVEAWKKAKGAWMRDEATKHQPFPIPFPTLRSVGQRLHSTRVGDEKHLEALKAAMKKLEPGFKAVQAQEGTLGNDISPEARAMTSWATLYQNVRLLPTMLFSSFNDVVGIAANGGTMKDSWDAFVSGIKEIKNSITDKKTLDTLRSEEWGAMDTGSLMDTLGQTYNSVYMTGKAKRMSDAFFKYTGAEGWNRGVRSVAANVAERIITDWAKNGVDLSDPAKKAQVEHLFGKGFDPKTIKLDDQGRLDITDEGNRAAVQRWVLDSVMSPNAANRPIWGSDPRWQLMMQMKNYTYTFHRVMLKNVIGQARLGNYRPAMVMLTGYVPVAIAGGALKEMLTPGDEPPWMKGGLDGYLQYGWDRAGLLGVPQMYASYLPSPMDVFDGKVMERTDPAAMFGPTADQIENLLVTPVFSNHTFANEALSALPGGTLLKRLSPVPHAA